MIADLPNLRRVFAERIAFLGGVLPSGGLEIINNQLKSLAAQDTDALSVGFFVGLAVTLWSANSGLKSLFEGMNVAYGETETAVRVATSSTPIQAAMGTARRQVTFRDKQAFWIRVTAAGRPPFELCLYRSVRVKSGLETGGFSG